MKQQSHSLPLISQTTPTSIISLDAREVNGLDIVDTLRQLRVELDLLLWLLSHSSLPLARPEAHRALLAGGSICGYKDKDNVTYTMSCM